MDDRTVKLIISATFTAEPLDSVLSFWMNKLGLLSEQTYAPFNQVFQQLLDSTGLFAGNDNGANISLVRLEDIDPDEIETDLSLQGVSNGPDADSESRNTDDLIAAVRTAAARDAVAHIVCLCPGNPTSDASLLERRTRFEKTFSQSLSGIAGVYTITTADILEAYPVNTYFDSVGASIGQIPYTPLFFAALGTTIARMFVSISRPPYKVVVLDCDQTLWSGISGEDGPLGVVIDSPRRTLQQFFVDQQRHGMLLCLCSKNTEKDVWSVFDQNPDMVIKKDHFTSWRINWQAKSENLRSLAHELKLGLDSFLFIDDSAIECAEVRANCPDVLVLQLPDKTEQIPRYLRHIWTFDKCNTTDEDQQRARFYKEDAPRERLQSATPSFEEFLSKLNLVVHFSEADEDDIPRMAQLCERTNQFNLSGHKWSEEGLIKALRYNEFNALVVRVKDRFGDYGFVGLILYRRRTDSILIDTFLLSCRALGRGVEHRMIQKLGQICSDLGLESIVLPYEVRPRNEPIRTFLYGIRTDSVELPDGDFQVSLSVRSALELPAPDAPPAVRAAPDSVSELKHAANSAADFEQTRTIYSRIAGELNEPEKILYAIESRMKMPRQEMTSTFDSPLTPSEIALADIWSNVLLINRIGRTDNFFELGGDSLKAVMLLSRIYSVFKVRLSVLDFFEGPTVSELAEAIDRIARNRNNATSL
ncbi:MAG: hypothetical protein BMS9Abin05_2665 [Rhodothermia bacterium]|nr:MAG: hypothetical protein BMS9Abin05_2665 [Rhodothermia bacterium]